MSELLLEFFSEEIPARMQGRACADLKRIMAKRLADSWLTFETMEAYATPRRLTLWITGLPKATPDTVEEKRGPRVEAQEQAIAGFIRAAGVTKEDLEVRDDPKGAVFFAVINRPGRPAAEVLAEIIADVARDFPWPKSMRWGSGDLRWVRPLHSILCLLSDGGDTEVVPVDLEGVPVGRTTRGHRFMAPNEFQVDNFMDYSQKLRDAWVILDPKDRVARIRAIVSRLAAEAELEVIEDDALLEEVAGLVEWPEPILGVIDEAFQNLPAEVLQTSMREHQKFFSLRNPESGQITHFVTVANIRAADAGERIQSGNERVLRARLADAQFFWTNDLAVSLEDMLPRLEAMIFHAKLGDQGDRLIRIRALAAELSEIIGAKPALADRAAELCKADLVSEMVYEFPELQGIMGRYYALAMGEDPEVAEAIAEHYRPTGAGDVAPRDPVAVSVALADRLDMLTCFWAIDEKPTGSKDPFALRRAALAVIRIALENALTLPLRPLIERHYFLAKRAQQNTHFSARGEEGMIGRNLAIRVLDRLYEEDLQAARDAAALGRDQSWAAVVDSWRAEADGAAESLLSFIADRLSVYLRDQGWRYDVVQAALAGGLEDIVDVYARVNALSSFLETDEGADLLAAYKRASNIVAAEERKAQDVFGSNPNRELAATPLEAALLEAMDAVDVKMESAMRNGRFNEALGAMAGLKGPLDAFFEGVVVNAPDPAQRENRLQLLNRVRLTMRRAADLGRIEAA